MNTNYNSNQNEDEILGKPIKKFFSKNNTNYTLIIAPNRDQSEVTLQLNEEFGRIFWKKTFNFQILLKEDMG